MGETTPVGTMCKYMDLISTDFQQNQGAVHFLCTVFPNWSMWLILHVNRANDKPGWVSSGWVFFNCTLFYEKKKTGAAPNWGQACCIVILLGESRFSLDCPNLKLDIDLDIVMKYNDDDMYSGMVHERGRYLFMTALVPCWDMRMSDEFPSNKTTV